MKRDPRPTLEQERAAVALHARIADIYRRTLAPPDVPDDHKRRVVFLPELLVQHFVGFLLGHARMDRLAAGVIASARWAGVPEDLRALLLGVVIEAATRIAPRASSPVATPRHVINSGGALAVFLVKDHGMTLGEASAAAAYELVRLGFCDEPPAARTVEAWARAAAARERVAMPARGRPRKPKKGALNPME